MLAISTRGIGPMDISQGQKSNGVSKEEEKAMEAFASLMDIVSTKQDDTGCENVVTDDTSLAISDKANDNKYESYIKENSVKSHKYDEDTKVVNTDKSNEDKNVETFNVEDEEAVATATQILKNVKEVIKEELGISDEELDKLLQDMGISLQDLLLGNNLKDFILQFSDATEVDLLINENVANLFSNINTKINDILQKFGIEDTQSFIEFVDDNQIQIMENLSSEVDVENDVDGDAVVESEPDKNTTVNKTTSDMDTSDNQKATLESKITTHSSNENSGYNADSETNTQVATNLSQAIDKAVTTSGVDATAFVDSVQEADIIRQIIDQVKVTVSKDVKSMELQLNPEQLGKVHINVVSEEGVMHTKIIAETEAAKQAIENNLVLLKEAFNNNELKVESIEVMVATYGFFEQTQDGQYGEEQGNNDALKTGSINIGELEDDVELTEEEELQVEIMKSQGNSVSYLA